MEDFVEKMPITVQKKNWTVILGNVVVVAKKMKFPGLGGPNATEKIKNTHREDPKRDREIVALDGPGCGWLRNFLK